jgi:hypothetical protein
LLLLLLLLMVGLADEQLHDSTKPNPNIEASYHICAASCCSTSAHPAPACSEVNTGQVRVQRHGSQHTILSQVGEENSQLFKFCVSKEACGRIAPAAHYIHAINTIQLPAV